MPSVFDVVVMCRKWKGQSCKKLDSELVFLASYLSCPQLGKKIRRQDRGFSFQASVLIETKLEGLFMRDITVDFLQSGEGQEAAEVLGYAFVTNPNSVAIWRAQGVW
jgi:hypothetical protein